MTSICFMTNEVWMLSTLVTGLGYISILIELVSDTTFCDGRSISFKYKKSESFGLIYSYESESL